MTEPDDDVGGSDTGRDEPPDVGAPYDELGVLADVVDDADERERAAAAMRTAAAVEPPNVFGRIVVDTLAFAVVSMTAWGRGD